jgi:hypothetical protein
MALFSLDAPETITQKMVIIFYKSRNYGVSKSSMMNIFTVAKYTFYAIMTQQPVILRTE